ncbi:MAG: hypothetical protein ACK4FV_07330 [Candidatus Nitrosocaldus sp.]
MTNIHIIWVISLLLLPILVINANAVDVDQKQPSTLPVKMRTDKDMYICGKDEKVIVSISGNPNTTYTLVVTKPDNTVLTYTITTDASGSASISIPLSVSEPSGTWILTLYDSNKRVVAEWKFHVKCEKEPTPEPMEPCLTVVSDTSTFVDRGNTVLVNFTWPAPINSNDLGVTGAKTIWSSNGLDTNNPYTFTRFFLLPSGNAYSAMLTINADDQWMDLKVNGQFVASEPFPGWGNVHTYDVSAYLQPGLNTLEVKAVDIGQAVAALAYKLDVKCKPIPASTHWDKIIFTIDVKQVQPSPTQPGNEELVKKLRPLIGKTLDIKVRDEPSEIAALEDTVKAFLAAKYNLSKQDLAYITVKIVEVEYAIDPNVHGKMVPSEGPQKPTEASSSTKGNRMNMDIDGKIGDGVYYALPLMGIGIAGGLGAFIAMRYRRGQNY